MPNLRRFEYRGVGTAGPWVMLNPSPTVNGVFIESLFFDGEFGNNFTIVFFRAPIRSTFLQRLALARHLTFDRADKRLIWLREHQMRLGGEAVEAAFEVSVPVGVDQALFVAAVGDGLEPFRLEVFGRYFST